MRRRYYVGIGPPRPSSPRRSSVTGTVAEIMELRSRHKHLISERSYHTRMSDLYREYLVQDIHKAEQAYAKMEYHTCLGMCSDIIRAKPPSDTIKAKAYMLLAKPEIMPNSPTEREHYAKRAISCWDIVIDRKGYCQSKFPIDQAKEQRQKAQKLLDDAQWEKNNISDTETEPDTENQENVHPATRRIGRPREPR